MDHEHDQDRGVENCQHKYHSRSSCSMGIAKGRLKACKSTILIVFPWLWLDQGNLQNDPEKTWKDLKGTQNIIKYPQIAAALPNDAQPGMSHAEPWHVLACPPQRHHSCWGHHLLNDRLQLTDLLSFASGGPNWAERQGSELRERSVIEVWKKAGEFCDDKFLEKQNHYR